MALALVFLVCNSLHLNSHLVQVHIVAYNGCDSVGFVELLTWCSWKFILDV
jgi:hypothetical protein